MIRRLGRAIRRYLTSPEPVYFSAPVEAAVPAWAFDLADYELLLHSAETRERVELVVTGCAYSCCGRGWQRRDGYEQTYVGYVDNLEVTVGLSDGAFMLYSVGMGTISYVLAVRLEEVADVQPVAA